MGISQSASMSSRPWLRKAGRSLCLHFDPRMFSLHWFFLLIVLCSPQRSVMTFDIGRERAKRGQKAQKCFFVKNFVTLAQNIEIFNGVRFYIFQNLSVHFPFYDATLGQELWRRHRRWLLFNRCQGNFYKILEKFCKISIFLFSLCDSLEFKFRIFYSEMMFPNLLFVLMQFPFCNFFQCLYWWRGDCVTQPLFSAFLLKHFFLLCSLKLMEIHQKR